MQIFSCDFETTTDPNDCRVWAWGASEVGKTEHKLLGNSIETFIEWIQGKNIKCYFHGLAFDGEFIISHLLKNGWKYSKHPKEGCFHTIISNLGLWYAIEIYWKVRKKHTIKTTIWDSLKLIPFSVRQIAHDFNLPIRKLHLDYDANREPGHLLTKEEKEYLFNDIDIVAMALEQLFDEGFNKMTATGASYKAFKESLGDSFNKLYPGLSLESDADIRQSYSGGFVWANPRHKEKLILNGMVFDVNSLYPSRMYLELLPYGLPTIFEGEPNPEILKTRPLWVANVNFAFDIKPDHIPCISLDKVTIYNGSKEYIDSSNGEVVSMTLTNVDWELIQHQYDVYDVSFNGGYYFRGNVGVARPFIDECMEVKKKEKGAKRFIAKRKMNSVYGKFATNPDVTPKIPYLDEEGVLRMKEPKIKVWNPETDEITEEIDTEMRDPIYLPYATFVTAYARKYTIITAQKVGIDRVAYIDTDSIHLVGTDVPDAIKDIIDDKELGYWGLESVFKRAYFVGAKTYIEEIEISYNEYNDRQSAFIEDHDKKDNLVYLRDGIAYRLNVKCAGMTESAKQNITFETFKVGTSVPGCLKKSHVPGGVVLYDAQFKIKRR